MSIFAQNEKSFSEQYDSIQDDMLKGENKVALLVTDIREKEILVAQLQQISAEHKMEQLLQERDVMMSSMNKEIRNITESLDEQVKKLSIIENETRDELVNISKEKGKIKNYC